MSIKVNFSRGFVKDIKRLRKRYRLKTLSADGHAKVGASRETPAEKGLAIMGEPPARPYTLWNILEISFELQLLSIHSWQR